MFRVFGDRVAAKLVESEKTSKAGLILVDSDKSNIVKGEIVSYNEKQQILYDNWDVSDSEVLENSSFIYFDVRNSDEIEHDNVKYKIINREHILAVSET